MLPLVIPFPRLLAAFQVIPLLGSVTIPMMVRVGIVMSLAMFLHPFNVGVIPRGTLSPLFWTIIVVKEVVIGIFLGFVCSLFIWSVEAIGSMLDTVVGNNNLFLFNPTLNQQTGPFSIMLGQFGAMLFIALGGLPLTLNTLFTSFVVWPILSFSPDWSDAARTFLLERSGDLLAVALQLTMPTFVLLMLVDLSLGLINRVAPQVNAFQLSMPIKTAVALLSLVLTVTFLVDPGNPLRRLMAVGGAFLKVPL